MKKIIIALTLIGCVSFSASAKLPKRHLCQNYRVCQVGGTYQVCGAESSAVSLKKWAAKDESTKAWAAKDESTRTWAANDQKLTTWSANDLSMNSVHSYAGYYRKHNIVVSDDMRAPYEGEPSRQWDGPVKNEVRNINTNQSSIYLPPNTGSNY